MAKQKSKKAVPLRTMRRKKPTVLHPGRNPRRGRPKPNGVLVPVAGRRAFVRARDAIMDH